MKNYIFYAIITLLLFVLIEMFCISQDVQQLINLLSFYNIETCQN